MSFPLHPRENDPSSVRGRPSTRFVTFLEGPRENLRGWKRDDWVPLGVRGVVTPVGVVSRKLSPGRYTFQGGQQVLKLLRQHTTNGVSEDTLRLLLYPEGRIDVRW